MPKNNKVTKRDGIIRKSKVPAKLRIGTRKAGKSAIGMTTDALKAILTSDNHKRDHCHARTVLIMRGETV